MATRTKDLEPIATPVADKLAKEYGELKRVLSAGVLALDWMPPDYQKVFMARAGGSDAPLPPADEEYLRQYMSKAVVLARMQLSRSGPGPVTKPPKSSR